MAAALALSILATLTPPGNTLTLPPPGSCSVESQVVGLLPFGAGQLTHGDTGLGVALATTQAAALAVNLGSWLDARGRAHDRVQGHVVAQYAGLAAFGLLWSLGAWHAQGYCTSTTRPALATLSIDVTAPPLPALAPPPEQCTPCDAAPPVVLGTCAPCPHNSTGVEVALAGTWANIDVDGERVRNNQMGLVALPLPPGAHVLRFSQPRARAQEVYLTVTADAQTPRLVIKLRPLPARLRITGAPEGGLVRIGTRRVPVWADPVLIELDVAAARDQAIEILGPTGETFHAGTVRLRPAEETSLALQPQP